MGIIISGTTGTTMSPLHGYTSQTISLFHIQINS